eukprot:1001606_1
MCTVLTRATTFEQSTTRDRYHVTFSKTFVYFCLLFLQAQSQGLLPNTYKKRTGLNGEDIWTSTSWFQAGGADSYGTIKIGQVMVIELDWRYIARVNTPTAGAIESFFRIGNASGTNGCSEGTRYPSLWLAGNTQNDEGPLLLSYTSGSTCDVSQTLWDYGSLSALSDTTIWTHITITIDWTTVTVDISGGNKQDFTSSWNREITQKAHLGNEVPIWFGSDGGWNIGQPKMRRITITSSVFTYSPTSTPTNLPSNPTATPSSDPSTSPSRNPSKTPSVHPTSNPSAPSLNPTLNPSVMPSMSPSNPTSNPSSTPSSKASYPTASPSTNPSNPTSNPSTAPSHNPAAIPSVHPTSNPSAPPSLNPTLNPSVMP